MPLNLTQAAALVADKDFQGRVMMAFQWVARQVITESSAVPGHEVRVRFAWSVTRQSPAEFANYTAMVVTDPAIVSGGPYALQAAVGDDRVIAAVSSMWNTLAGVPQAG